MTLNHNQKRWVWLAVAVLGLTVLIWNEMRTAPATAGEGYQFKRIQVWVAALATLAVYSFLVRDNAAYRAVEHAFVGAAMGMGVTIVVIDILVSKWVTPMYGAFRSLFTKGPSPEAVGGALLLIPGVIGTLWLFQLTKRHNWLSRIPLCIGLGVGAGMGFKNIFNTMLPQITSSFRPLWIGTGINRDAGFWTRVGGSLENLIFVVGTISVLSYFFFAFGRRKYGIRAPAKLGRWYLMLSLGAFFGNTFMSRLSALIERVQFLLSEWLRVTSV